MAKFNEQTLTNWTKPPSDSEQTKLENSERMVRDAIREDEKLKKISTETFGQGSYANDTNVRLNSDIDINVRYTDGFYFDLPENTTETNLGLDRLPAAGYFAYQYCNRTQQKFTEKNITQHHYQIPGFFDKILHPLPCPTLRY